MTAHSERPAGSSADSPTGSTAGPGAEPTAAPSTVRIAWAADAEQIARIQVRSWQQAYAGILPAELLDDLSEAGFANRWQVSLARPDDARNRVLLGLGDAGQPIGFAAIGPCTDPDADQIADGEIEAFHLDPDTAATTGDDAADAADPEGHAARLLHACVDTLRADGFASALTWVFSADDGLRAFLADSGWAPDGAHRELDLYGDGSVRVKQVRLHTALS